MSKRHTKQQSTGRTPARRFRMLIMVGALILLTAATVSLIHWPRQSGSHNETPPQQRVADGAHTRTLLGGKLVFTDAADQAREFIGYNSTIRLTAAQEKIKREVLGSMHAACCRNSDAYTCCCPCNLSKSVWGLSNYVLARHGATADELRDVVRAWYSFTNSGGYSGDVCYTGGCDRPFHKNGCGGMSESKIAA